MPHGFQGSDTALIAAGEHCDLAFLPQFTVDAMLVNGDTKHARGGLAVQIHSISEGLKSGGLTCKPGNHPCLDRREVGQHEPVLVSGDKRSADELGEGVGYRVVEQLDRINVSDTHEFSGLGQVGQVVAGQVVDLNQAACKPASAPCPIELEETPPTTITTCHVLLRLVLLHRRLRELATQLQDLAHLAGSRVECGGNVVFR